MNKKFKGYEDAISGVVLLIVLIILMLLVGSCEVSYIYVTGDNNNIKEQQTEDVNVSTDSLEINGLKKGGFR